MKNKEQWVSVVGVVFLALILPGILRLSNSVVRLLVGAEGRLAAITVETDQTLGPLPTVWKGIAQGGDEVTTFTDKYSKELGQLGPRHIRIDHIYDQFEVVSRNGQGQLEFNWEKLDKTIKGITNSGATPFLALSYMPAALSSGDETAEPKNWQEWSLLVQKTIERYSGEAGIPNVYYEVWNEPDLFGKWKMGGNKDYKNLYLYAARGAAAAKTSQAYKFGGPATTGLYQNWLDGFLPFVLQNQLRLDFFSWHRYSLDSAEYAKDVENVDKWLDSHPYFARTEKIISEMGPRSERGRENDNGIGAAQLLAVTREVLAKADEAITFAAGGDWGIIGKPRFQAWMMLNQLGGQRLGVGGEGSWVRAIAAQKGRSYQALVVNYDPRNIHGEMVPITFINLKGTQFDLSTQRLGENPTTQEMATTGGILQKQIYLKPNSAVLLELTDKSNLQPEE